MSGSSFSLVIFHGSAPFPKYPSVNKTTGVECSKANLEASNAQSKQLAGVLAATIIAGLSPFLPYSACIRSDCSVFVGNPVEGPPL